MKPKVFLSYSRCQTPFVDAFADQLEDSGYSVWLDYQSLVPAQPWSEQIESGINAADVLILIVSKESIASEHVEIEWKLALEFKKHIILAIFETVLVPEELQRCEWVDFRIHYKESVQVMRDLLENPGLMNDPPPQREFKAPGIFWISLVLSVVVMIASIPNWWLLLIPYILVPLPWQIYQRNYNIYRVMPALLYLPFLYLFTIPFATLEGELLYSLQIFTFVAGCSAPLASWILLGLLVTPTMQRRGLPEAAQVRFANPLVVTVEKPRSVGFAIDYAPEDHPYAEDIRIALEQYGHRMVDADETPEVIFVLISAHKTATLYDSDHQVVYPILLQPVGEIDFALQRIQWIDFRKGLVKVDKLAKLLPEPEHLLKALAVPPVGTQEVYPLSVLILQYFYVISGTLGIAGLLMFILSFGVFMLQGNISRDEFSALFLVIFDGALLIWSVLVALRALRSRKSGASTLYPLSVLTIFQLTIHLSIFYVPFIPMIAFSEDPSLLFISAFFVPILSIIVLISVLFIGIPILAFHWRELYRWLPIHQNRPTGTLEKLLLLYTPGQGRTLFSMWFFM
jgi:TIR domain